MSASGARSDASWRLRARQVIAKAFDFLLPPVCVSCQSVGSLFCRDCYRSLVWLGSPMCACCGRPLARSVPACASCLRDPLPLRQVRATCAFTGTVRDAIHAFKYEGMFAMAGPLSQLLAEGWPAWEDPVDLVIPIPLHPERERERGYNQSALLVRHLCRRLELRGEEEALWRTRHTRPQIGLTVEQRRQNVRSAFAADGPRVAGKRVLLVDDVFTSGATMASAAGALLARDARSVSGYCLARPI